MEQSINMEQPSKMDHTNLDDLIVISWKLVDLGSETFEKISSNLKLTQINTRPYFKLIT
jgi:hypothetical protein